MNSTEILSIENDTLFLNSFMAPLAFAKSRFSEQIKTPAVLLKKNGDGWETLEWIFDHTENNSEDTSSSVILVGNAFKGTTLYNALKNMHEEKNIKICLTAINALNEIIKKGLCKKVENIGAGGIFISDDLDKVLFIQKVFFTNAAKCAGDRTYSLEQGMFINEQLNGQKAVRFTQSVIAYSLLTGKLPFENENTLERQNDILDRNFIPVEYIINGIDESLAEFILSSLTAIREGYKSKYIIEETVLFPEEILTSQLELIKNNSLSKKYSEQKFLERTKRFSQKENIRISRKRKIKKYRTPIILVSVILAVGAVFGISFFTSNMGKPTTKGLTSLQALNAYYSAVNKLNVDLAMNTSSGSSMSGTINILSNIYVSTKARSMYNPALDVKPFVQWLCYNKTSANICGVSQLTILDEAGNMQDSQLYIKVPVKKSHPKIITEENGEPVKNGDAKKFTVSYYTVLTYADDDIIVTKITDSVKLTFKKDRWVVTEILSDTAETAFSRTEFINDYTNAVANFPEDVFAIVKNLRAKYDWIPTDGEINQAIAFLETEKIW